VKKIAIDIALIPPENILDTCIALHNSCEIRRFQLWKNDFVPHISLRLMWIYEKDLDEVIKIVSRTDFRNFNISLTGVSSRKKQDWNYNMIDILVDTSLQSFHEDITKITSPYSQIADTADMIVEWDKTWWDESAKRWINNFYTDHSFEKYNPHISLWCYNLDYSHIIFPIIFECSRLCIFQVWNVNTCRKLLWEKTI